MASGQVLVIGPGFRAYVNVVDEAADIATCRGCGCTDDRGCLGGCAWVEDPEGEGDLCSQCLVALWNGVSLPLEGAG